MTVSTIHFRQDGVSGALDVTRVGENEVRLDQVPVLLSDLIEFRDVMEVDENADGSLTFVRVSERSGWQTHCIALPKEKADSPLLEEACKRAEVAGAHWERIFGGLLFVSVPPGSDFNPGRELDEIFNDLNPG